MPYKQYDVEDMERALVSVRNGEMSTYKASKNYKVPYQSLSDRVKNIHTNPSGGHAKVLTNEEEQLIVKWIHHMAEIGFPVTKDQLLHSVGKLVKELKRPNPFKDGIPGRHWYEGFLKRNTNVSARVCQALTVARVGATETKIRHWFDYVYKFLEGNNYLDILEDPSRIFNCDESAFFLCPKGKPVLARKGQSSVYCRSGNDDKENLTLSLGASAEGKLMPILAIFPYKRLPASILQKYPKSWVIGRSDNGWMTCETFYEYITNAFNNFLIKENIKKPVLLFLDGHVSHLSLPLTTFCKENGIILVALLPNSTHALQPMDVAVFHSLKNAWRKSVHNWRMAHNAEKIKREDFGPLLEECIQTTLKPETLKNGFRRTGLFPFDQNAVDYSKLLKSSQSSDASDTCSTGSTPSEDGSDRDKQSVAERPQPKLDQIASCPSNPEQFVAEFETLLGIEKLTLFKDCDGVWEGDIKDENLFYFWKDLKGYNNLELELGESTLEANDCTLTNISLNWGNDGVLEGIVENDGTVTLTPHLPSSPKTETPFTKKSQPKRNEAIVTEDDASFTSNDFCPVFDNTSTPTTKSKQNTQIFEEKSTQPNQKPSESLELETFPSNCTTPPPQQTCEMNKNDLPETSVSSLNTDSQAKNPVVEASTQIHDDHTPSNSNKSQFPTPFKNALIWPETVTTGKAKKNVKKKLIPTVATSTEFIEYQRRIEQEKKEKIEKAQLRKQERQEKAKAKLTKTKDTLRNSEGNKKDKATKNKTSRHSEAEDSLESENITEETEDNKASTTDKSFKTGEYVVVTYEGENFPGLIIKVSEGTSKTYDIKTMTMSGLDTITGRVNWRWPDKDDILTYDCDDIVKKIKDPKPLNKRGVFSVVDF